MSETLGQVDPAHTPDTITITRPSDVKPAAWEYRATMVHLAMTGHYPWCQAHQDPEPGETVGWCVHAERWEGIGLVELHNGTLDGSPRLQLDIDEALNLDSLGLNEAMRFAALIQKAAELGTIYNAPRENER